MIKISGCGDLSILPFLITQNILTIFPYFEPSFDIWYLKILWWAMWISVCGCDNFCCWNFQRWKKKYLKIWPNHFMWFDLFQMTQKTNNTLPCSSIPNRWCISGVPQTQNDNTCLGLQSGNFAQMHNLWCLPYHILPSSFSDVLPCHLLIQEKNA